MKKLLPFLLLLPLKIHSQRPVFGEWYHIGTERLGHMSVLNNHVRFGDRTFDFKDKEGEENVVSILSVFQKSDMTGIVYKNEDTSDINPFGMAVLQHGNEPFFLDMVMDCSLDFYRDTAGLHEYFGSCNTRDKLIMRFYSRSAIDSFRTLKPVVNITKNDLAKIKGAFKNKTELLIKKHGEDKLLWVAPVIFQQVLTDLLLEGGYNPMITKKQAENLFDFYFF